MTGGGLMQLVAYGAQDVYLTGNPQITFFKVVYRRHTNFAMESIENPFNGSPGFGKQVTVTIQRNGDLIYRMYLQATLPKVQLLASDGSGAQFRWLNWPGHNLIKEVELQVDTHLVVLEGDQRQRQTRVAAEPELEGDVEGVFRGAVLDFIGGVGFTRRAVIVASLTTLDD